MTPMQNIIPATTLCVLARGAAMGPDVLLATFDPADTKTTFDWATKNDPVMYEDSQIIIYSTPIYHGSVLVYTLPYTMVVFLSTTLPYTMVGIVSSRQPSDV